MKKAIVAAILVVGMSMSGCGSSQTWQESLVEEFDKQFTQSDIDDICAGFALFGINTPEQAGAIILGFDEGELPPSNTTVAEWVTAEGGSLDNIPGDLNPEKVTVKDLANEIGAYLITRCES